MSRYSKTKLRKGEVRPSRPAKASSSAQKGKGVNPDEEALLFGTDSPVKAGEKK